MASCKYFETFYFELNAHIKTHTHTHKVMRVTYVSNIYDLRREVGYFNQHSAFFPNLTRFSLTFSFVLVIYL